jgi:hypothetical protein
MRGRTVRAVAGGAVAVRAVAVRAARRGADR